MGQAVILAGGKGTRLRPYTTVFPKPLMPVGDYPILEVVIRQLKHRGFEDIVLAVGHLKELIQAFFEDGKKWGTTITYSDEEKPLGTAAPLKLIDGLRDDFLVMNGDVLTDLDYGEFFRFHREKGALCTIAMYRKEVKIDLGVLKTDEEGALVEYVEKPTLKYQVSMGVYAFKKEVLDYIPTGVYFDFPVLIETLLEQKKKVIGYDFNGYWLDIGRPDDYRVAVKEFTGNQSLFMPVP